MLNLKRSVVFFAAILGLISVGADGANGGGKDKAKNYEISLHTAMNVGTVVLKAGDYKFKVEGSNAIFTGQSSGKVFTAPCKVETGSENFDRTMFHQIQDGGQSRITAIELKGTQSLVKFD